MAFDGIKSFSGGINAPAGTAVDMYDQQLLASPELFSPTPPHPYCSVVLEHLLCIVLYRVKSSTLTRLCHVSNVESGAPRQPRARRARAAALVEREMSMSPRPQAAFADFEIFLWLYGCTPTEDGQRTH